MPKQFADIDSSPSASASLGEPYDSVCEIVASFDKELCLATHPELPLKQEIRRCQTIFWYEHLRKRTGLVTSRAMQKLFEPDTFVPRKGEGFICSNKWQAYRQGAHKPHPKLVDRVDKSMPGSAKQLRHPLWEILNVDEPIGNQGEGILKRFDPDLQSKLFLSGRRGARRVADARLAAVLKRRCDVDTLAVMTLLCREASESQDYEMALYWAGETYYMLLRLGLELHRHGVCPLLVRFFRRHIFAKCTRPGWTFHNQDEDIGLCMGFLVVLEHELPAHRRSADSKAQLLTGRLGRFPCKAFQPIWRAELSVKGSAQRHDRMLRDRAVGWEAITSADLRFPYS